MKKIDLVDNKNTIIISLEKLEGERLVTRKIRYYSFDCVARICLSTKSFKHTQRYRDFLREMGIVFPENIPVPCDEKNYTEYLSVLFDGILDIDFEHKIGKYRVDGIIRSLSLIFELDGDYHNIESIKKKDVIRERYIKSKYPGFKFVRFNKDEFHKLSNLILKMIFDIT